MTSDADLDCFSTSDLLVLYALPDALEFDCAEWSEDGGESTASTAVNSRRVGEGLLLVEEDDGGGQLEIQWGWQELNASAAPTKAAEGHAALLLGPDDAIRATDSAVASAHTAPVAQVLQPPLRLKRLLPIQPAAAQVPVGTGPRDAKQAAPQSGAAPPKGRKRVKDEIARLRQSVADLEEQLRSLQLRGDEGAVGGARDGVNTPATQVAPMPVQLWKRVATRQLDARRRAEAENARLRGALEAQRKLDAAPPPRPTALSSCRSFFSDASSSSSIFTGLAERLGPLYASLDAVLAEAGVAAEKKEVCSARVRSSGDGRLYLELVSAIMLPFDRPTVSAAFGQLFVSSSMQSDGGVDEGPGSDGDCTLRSRFSVNYQLQCSESEFHGHLLGQQVLEDSRAVLVWNTAGECRGSLFGSAQMQIQEAGWLAIEEVAAPSASASGAIGSSGSTTIVRTVLRVHPRVVGGDGEMSDSAVPSAHVYTLADAVASALPQNLEKLQRLTEDIILGAVDTGRRGGSVFHGVCNSAQQHPELASGGTLQVQ